MIEQIAIPYSEIVGLCKAYKVQELALAVTTLFQRKIDLVPKDGLHHVIREHILEEAKTIYAV